MDGACPGRGILRDDDDLLLNIIRLRLEIAARLLERLISPSWHVDSPYSCQVVGEAFKTLARAVGEAIDDETDEQWVAMFRSWKDHHREMMGNQLGWSRPPIAGTAGFLAPQDGACRQGEKTL